MDIDHRARQQGDALQKIGFCLDLLEREGFAPGVSWNTDVTDRLTHAEQSIAELQDEEEEGSG